LTGFLPQGEWIFGGAKRESELLMFGSFGWMELVLILIIVLIIFGAGKIPQLGEGLGKAIKGFKKSVNEADAIDVTPPPSDVAEPQPTQIAQAQPAPPANAPVQSEHQVKQG
jgi:sec-independent protein translocase protein TatA